jgi:Cu/Ag efflux protein CusF
MQIERSWKMWRQWIIAPALSLLIAISAAGGQVSKANVNGVVVKIDQSAGKITLKHSEIPDFHMEAMTMVFPVRDAMMLNGIRAGDKVSFKIEEINGMKTVTEVRAAK